MHQAPQDTVNTRDSPNHQSHSPNITDQTLRDPILDFIQAVEQLFAPRVHIFQDVFGFEDIEDCRTGSTSESISSISSTLGKSGNEGTTPAWIRRSRKSLGQAYSPCFQASDSS